MSTPEIGSPTPQALEQALISLGQPAYRAAQVFSWIHEKRAQRFAEMTNLPAPLRRELEGRFSLSPVQVESKRESELDGTVKYLFSLPDGECVEAVLMRYRHGDSLCISTQAGCRMGCTFCASSTLGFSRSLTPWEMLSEVYEAERDSGRKVGSLVLMGIGEPLDNLENVLAFLALLSHPKGKNLSLRHVTLSTCGLADKIEELAEKKLQLTLSVSLHAPDDALRGRTMPVNRAYPIPRLMQACRFYEERTGRRVSFEYALIAGVNDSLEQANALAALLKGTLCHVNLIPVNEVEETGYRHSGREQVFRFQRALEGQGIPVTVRRTLGADIEAACGQLRKSRLQAAQSSPGG